MRRKNNSWEKLSKFTVSRVIIILWNIAAFFYHLFYIGIDIRTCAIIQIAAIITEYLVCGWYESMLIWSNRKINDKTIWINFGKKILIKVVSKFIVFSAIFYLIYGTLYYLRLKFFYQIDFGVDLEQFNQSIFNMSWFGLISGPIMAIIVIERKKKKRKDLFKKRKGKYVLLY